jgi:hypothetical protein
LILWILTEETWFLVSLTDEGFWVSRACGQKACG